MRTNKLNVSLFQHKWVWAETRSRTSLEPWTKLNLQLVTVFEKKKQEYVIFVNPQKQFIIKAKEQATSRRRRSRIIYFYHFLFSSIYTEMIFLHCRSSDWFLKSDFKGRPSSPSLASDQIRFASPDITNPSAWVSVVMPKGILTIVLSSHGADFCRHSRRTVLCLQVSQKSLWNQIWPKCLDWDICRITFQTTFKCPSDPICCTEFSKLIWTCHKANLGWRCEQGHHPSQFFAQLQATDEMKVPA